MIAQKAVFVTGRRERAVLSTLGISQSEAPVIWCWAHIVEDIQRLCVWRLLEPIDDSVNGGRGDARRSGGGGGGGAGDGEDEGEDDTLNIQTKPCDLREWIAEHRHEWQRLHVHPAKFTDDDKQQLRRTLFSFGRLLSPSLWTLLVAHPLMFAEFGDWHDVYEPYQSVWWVLKHWISPLFDPSSIFRVTYHETKGLCVVEQIPSKLSASGGGGGGGTSTSESSGGAVSVHRDKYTLKGSIIPVSPSELHNMRALHYPALGNFCGVTGVMVGPIALCNTTKQASNSIRPSKKVGPIAHIRSRISNRQIKYRRLRDAREVFMSYNTGVPVEYFQRRKMKSNNAQLAELPAENPGTSKPSKRHKRQN